MGGLKRHADDRRRAAEDRRRARLEQLECDLADALRRCDTLEHDCRRLEVESAEQLTTISELRRALSDVRRNTIAPGTHWSRERDYSEEA